MINNYISSRGEITFFDDRKPPPPIPVGASVFYPLRARPDVPAIIGEYETEWTPTQEDE
jgi:hypothetical protein